MHIALGLGIVVCVLYILWKFGMCSKTVSEGFEEEDLPPAITNENCAFLISQKKGYEEALAAAEKEGGGGGTYKVILDAVNASIKEVGCNGTEVKEVVIPVLTPAAVQAIAAVKASA